MTYDATKGTEDQISHKKPKMTYETAKGTEVKNGTASVCDTYDDFTREFS